MKKFLSFLIMACGTSLFCCQAPREQLNLTRVHSYLDSIQETIDLFKDMFLLDVTESATKASVELKKLELELKALSDNEGHLLPFFHNTTTRRHRNGDDYILAALQIQNKRDDTLSSEQLLRRCSDLLETLNYHRRLDYASMQAYLNSLEVVFTENRQPEGHFKLAPGVMWLKTRELKRVKLRLKKVWRETCKVDEDEVLLPMFQNEVCTQNREEVHDPLKEIKKEDLLGLWQQCDCLLKAFNSQPR